MDRMVQKQKERMENGMSEENDEIPQGSMPTLIVHDSLSSSIYALAVAKKGTCSDANRALRSGAGGLGVHASDPQARSGASDCRTRTVRSDAQSGGDHS